MKLGTRLLDKYYLPVPVVLVTNLVNDQHYCTVRSTKCSLLLLCIPARWPRNVFGATITICDHNFCFKRTVYCTLHTQKYTCTTVRELTTVRTHLVNRIRNRNLPPSPFIPAVVYTATHHTYVQLHVQYSTVSIYCACAMHL